LPAILDELPAEEAGLPVLTNELHPLTEESSEAPPKWLSVLTRKFGLLDLGGLMKFGRLDLGGLMRTDENVGMVSA